MMHRRYKGLCELLLSCKFEHGHVKRSKKTS